MKPVEHFLDNVDDEIVDDEIGGLFKKLSIYQPAPELITAEECLKNNEINKAEQFLDVIAQRTRKDDVDTCLHILSLRFLCAYRCNDEIKIKNIFSSYLELKKEHTSSNALEITILQRLFKIAEKCFDIEEGVLLFRKLYDGSLRPVGHYFKNVPGNTLEWLMLDLIFNSANSNFITSTMIDISKSMDTVWRKEYLYQAFEVLLSSFSNDDNLFQCGFLYLEQLKNDLHHEDKKIFEETMTEFYRVSLTLYRKSRELNRESPELKNEKWMFESGLFLLDFYIVNRTFPNIMDELDKIDRRHFTKEQLQDFRKKKFLLEMIDIPKKELSELFYSITVGQDFSLDNLYPVTFSAHQYSDDAPIFLQALSDMRKICSYYQNKDKELYESWSEFSLYCAEFYFPKLEDSIISCLKKKNNLNNELKKVSLLLDITSTLFKTDELLFKNGLIKLDAINMVLLHFNQQEEGKVNLLKDIIDSGNFDSFIDSLTAFTTNPRIDGEFFSKFLFDLIQKIEKNLDIAEYRKSELILTCLNVGRRYSEKKGDAYFYAFFIYQMCFNISKIKKEKQNSSGNLPFTSMPLTADISFEVKNIYLPEAMKKLKFSLEVTTTDKDYILKLQTLYVMLDNFLTKGRGEELTVNPMGVESINQDLLETKTDSDDAVSICTDRDNRLEAIEPIESSEPVELVFSDNEATPSDPETELSDNEININALVSNHFISSLNRESPTKHKDYQVQFHFGPSQ